MADLTLILDRRELVVRMDSKTIRVDRPRCRPQRFPLNMLASVIVIGSPMVSCDVWRTLAQKNIPVIMLPSRGGGPAAYIGAGLSAAIQTRMAQYDVACNTENSLVVARWLLSKKLKGQESVLKKLDSSKYGLKISCRQISECRMKLKTSTDRNSLMGHEGVAAAIYFKALGRLLPGKWKFLGRNKRPPRDPVNALFSLGYVLAGGEVRRAVQINGLDPALGFLHAPLSGRESLILDILEPIRPKVDKFALDLLDKSLTLKDFTTNKQDGCLLNKKGRRIFYADWTRWQGKSADRKNLQSVALEIIRELKGKIYSLKKQQVRIRAVIRP